MFTIYLLMRFSCRNELTFYMVRDKIKTIYGKSWKFTGLNHFSTSKEFPNENTHPKLI